MDPIDLKLLDLLREDARATTAALARKLGVARSTVQGRIARLEREQIIAGYTVRLGPGAAAPQVRAHVMIRVDPARARAVETALSRQKGVTALYTASGSYDFIAVVAEESTERLDTVIDAVRDLDGIVETNTAILLSAKVER